MKVFEILSENKLYSSITINDIPEEYKKLKLFGRGTTSIVYEHPNDASKVFLFTKDSIKKDWLIHGLKIGKVLNVFNSRYNYRYPDLSYFDIYMIEMPKLEKLNSINKKKIKILIDFFLKEKVKYYNKKLYNKEKTFDNIDFIHDLQNKINDIDLDFKIKKNFIEFLKFLENYNENQYQIDFSVKNFLQDKNGDVIFIDPVVDKEILNIFYDRKR